MDCTRKITDTIYWVGGSERRLELFENLFPIPRGISYNSYLIMDEKVALMDTVDFSISRQFIENIYAVLQERTIDYLIVQHMEPDHCANIGELLLRFPNLQIVANAKTVAMIKQYYTFDIDNKVVLVKEGDTLNLGEHTLQFIMAPMVHWPEVMVTYETKEKILFSADGFGTFGAMNGNIFNDEIDFEKEWLDDARRYYANIVGKYGPQVQALLKKAANLDIQMICPLHGPIWRNNLAYIMAKYQAWSTYEPEQKAIAIMYASIYGNTENAINVIANKLAQKGLKNIAIYDISKTDVSYLVSEAFRCSHLVLASPTYNGGMFPKMEALLNDMKALSVQKRTVGIMDNGTWAITAGKQMKTKLEELKEISILEQVISLKSTLKQEQLEMVDQFVETLYESLTK